jgi:hypothetical protein
VLGAVMSAKVSSLLPASWQAAHLPALNPAQLAGVKSAVSVGVAPVTSSTPPPGGQRHHPYQPRHVRQRDARRVPGRGGGRAGRAVIGLFIKPGNAAPAEEQAVIAGGDRVRYGPQAT